MAARLQRPQAAPSTLRRYSGIARRLKETLGSVLLQQLRPTQIQALYARLETGDAKHRPLSKRTVLHHHRVLREALHQAVRWQLLVANPADAATPPRPVNREMRTLSAQELHALLDSLGSDDLGDLVYVAVQTGARLGELLALRWSDLDLDWGHASIVRSLDEYRLDQEPIFRPPKTGRGRRSVALSSETVRVLREHRTAQVERRLGAPEWRDYDLVFADVSGTPLPKARVSRQFRESARRAGFAGLRFHDLRHTAATLMLGAGVHPKVVSERLGHSTIAITLDTYSHVLPDMQRDAAEKMDETLSRGLRRSAGERD